MHQISPVSNLRLHPPFHELSTIWGCVLHLVALLYSVRETDTRRLGIEMPSVVTADFLRAGSRVCNGDYSLCKVFASVVGEHAVWLRQANGKCVLSCNHRRLGACSLPGGSSERCESREKVNGEDTRHRIADCLIGYGDTRDKIAHNGSHSYGTSLEIELMKSLIDSISLHTPALNHSPLSLSNHSLLNSMAPSRYSAAKSLASSGIGHAR